MPSTECFVPSSSDLGRGRRMPAMALKLRVLAHWRALLDRLARRRIVRNERLNGELQAYLSRSGSTGCNYLDYWELYKAVRERKPREILECGTGVSTVVLAVA